MKKPVIILTLLLTGLFTLAQPNTHADVSGTDRFEKSSRRNGYIGFQFGMSFPQSDFGSEERGYYTDRPRKNGYAAVGLKWSYINVNYTLLKNVGIAASWNHMLHQNGEYEALRNWQTQSFVAGPMVIMPFQKDVSLAFRLMAGRGDSKLEQTDTGKSGLAVNAVSELRFHATEQWQLSVGLDYYYMNPQFSDPYSDLQITTLNLLLGFGYRF